MSVPFPLSPVPTTYYGTQFLRDARNNVFYVGQSVTLRWSNNGNPVGATAYTVRDYFGNTVSSGSLTPATTLSVTPTPPAGGWPPGWYRLYLTGATNDAVFGLSVGATNFCVIRSDSRFPTMPSTSVGYGGGEFRDLAMKGVMGIGTSRLQINDASNPTVGTDNLAACVSDAAIGATYWQNPGAPYADAARPRYMFCQFPNGTVDSLSPLEAGGVQKYLHIMCKDGTIDGSKVFVAVAAGSTSGTKITVSYPTSGTVVETYDNQATNAAAATAINATSAYIYAEIVNGNQWTGAQALAATAIGNAFFNGVKSVVQTLYPLGVTHFEGYANEPSGDSQGQQMRLFQAAVHAGNASAIAMGPCLVTMNTITNWLNFLNTGGGAYCDEFSTHAYNSPIDGNWMLGRTNFRAWRRLLTRFGFGSKPYWQTEATQAQCSAYGVYHPRRGRLSILITLLWEQYGLPREKNPPWYDTSHGFWGFPAWLENADASLNPQCVMYRTLAEETFGQTHSSIIDFGQLGNNVFFGSVYSAAGGSTWVMTAMSAMPVSTVTLSVAGASTLTTVDAFGNLTAVPVTKGLATIPVPEVPVYVRVPAGVTVSVYSCNDWPQINGHGQGADSTVLVRFNGAKVGNTITPIINSQFGQGEFTLSTGLVAATGTGSLPDTAQLLWPQATRVDRVVVWAQYLLDFDVQTTVDGTTWTTQRTITKTPTSLLHGTGAEGVGCQRETYWDEQWIFDVAFPAPVTCKGVRLYVRATAYGQEPDAACAAANGSPAPSLSVMEIACLCDDNTEQAVVLA